jgi:hypothetical protein
VSDHLVPSRSWRSPHSRDVVVEVRPLAGGERFVFGLTQELERLAEYVRRVRLLLTARYRVDADTAVAWLADARADDQRVVDLLARLDACAVPNEGDQ